jgi:hypothetical protein
LSFPASIVTQYTTNSVREGDPCGFARWLGGIIIHNKEMTIVKKLLFVALIALWMVPAIAAIPTYTLTPWPYGVIAWVETAPNATLLEIITARVEAVFSFWNQPFLTSAENWDELIEMPEDTWTESKYDPFTAGFVPIPSPTASVMWAIPLPSWQGEAILPLTLIAMFNPTLQKSLVGSHAEASFSHRSPIYTVLSLNPDPSLAMLMIRSNSVVFDYHSPQLRRSLYHELSHWLTSLLCQRHGLSLQDLPHMFREGFAEYTAYKLSRDTSWRYTVAVWAESHGLSDIPYHISYPVGASLIAFLVERDGIDAFIENLPDLAENWDQFISDITPAWQAWASNYEIDEAHRAYAEATIEQLALVYRILQPVLSYEAFLILDPVYSLAGEMDAIDRFWQLISAPIPTPSGDGWSKLHQEAHTIVVAACGYPDRELGNIARENAYQLGRLWAKDDWDGYYALLIRTLREVIAHYGLRPVEEPTR